MKSAFQTHLHIWSLMECLNYGTFLRKGFFFTHLCLTVVSWLLTSDLLEFLLKLPTLQGANTSHWLKSTLRKGYCYDMLVPVDIKSSIILFLLSKRLLQKNSSHTVSRTSNQPTRSLTSGVMEVHLRTVRNRQVKFVPPFFDKWQQKTINTQTHKTNNREIEKNRHENNKKWIDVYFKK